MKPASLGGLGSLFPETAVAESEPRPQDKGCCALFPNRRSCRICRIPDRSVALGQQDQCCLCLPLSFTDLGESHLWALCPSGRSAKQRTPLFSGTAGLGERAPTPRLPSAWLRFPADRLPPARCAPPESRCREAGRGRQGPGHGQADGIFTKPAAERRRGTGQRPGLLPVTEVPPNTPGLSRLCPPLSHLGPARGP